MTRTMFTLAGAAAMLVVAAGAFAAEPFAAEALDLAPRVTPSPLPPPAQPPAQPPPPGIPANLTGASGAPVDDARLRQWFDQLAHPNSAARDQARLALMGIMPADLGVLRSVVDAARPLSPAQAAVLHDVVIHVYVGNGVSERAWGVRRSGFLGVLLEPVLSESGLGLAPAPLPPDENPPDFVQFHRSGGVLIRETWPGFAGFRFLRVGDVVIGTGGEQPTRAPTVSELRAAVQATTPGQTLDLQVLRQGRVTEVPVRVSARPAWAEDELSTRQMQSRRLRRAEIYWKFAFAPLLLQDGGML